VICAASLLASGCFKEQSHQENAQSKKDIEALFANWQKAFEAKDVNGVMAIYAPGATLTAFDVVGPLQFKGADAYRKDYADFFAQFKGPIRVADPDMQIVAGNNVGVAYGVERLTGTLTNGTSVDMWLRYTEGLERIDGQWRVIHEHISVPVDLDTGKAKLDLKP
jgi:uncharacterized protein (TIGR02246 family)